MNLYWHKHANNRSLLLVFNGWGCDENILSGVDKDNHDILLLSDYTDFNNSFIKEIQSYKSVQIIAWSFGVSIANHLLPLIPQVSYSLAVNGTIHPIDNEKGIPHQSYYATLNNLSEHSRDKFFRRMMGGKNNVDLYNKFLPKRTIESQTKELKQFIKWNSLNEFINPKWSKIVIGAKDNIFPPANIMKAWTNCQVDLIEEYHFIPFQKLIESYL